MRIYEVEIWWKNKHIQAKQNLDFLKKCVYRSFVTYLRWKRAEKLIRRHRSNFNLWISLTIDFETVIFSFNPSPAPA